VLFRSRGHGLLSLIFSVRNEKRARNRVGTEKI